MTSFLCQKGLGFEIINIKSCLSDLVSVRFLLKSPDIRQRYANFLGKAVFSKALSYDIVRLRK